MTNPFGRADLLSGLEDPQTDVDRLEKRRREELAWVRDALRTLDDELAVAHGKLEAEIRALQCALDTERMRLAACGTVALANTSESAGKARDVADEYRSASLRDVCSAVDREMRYRGALATIREEFACSPNHRNLIAYIDTVLRPRA